MLRVIENFNWGTLNPRRNWKPTILLLLPSFLVAIHRIFGSMEFSHQFFPQGSNLHAAFYMFASSFFLMGILPLGIILFVFREDPKEYGLRVGDWKFGIFSLLVLFPLIAGILLYPASQIQEMRNFYPFDKGAGVSTVAFLRLEIPRGLLYYTSWEFFFRGFMLFGLRKIVGDWNAICIQTLPSTLWHIGMPTGEVFASIFGGILFGLLSIRTRSILWPFLLHFLIGVGMDFFIVIST